MKQFKNYDMIDLDKLEAIIDKTLSEETRETLLEFLNAQIESQNVSGDECEKLVCVSCKRDITTELTNRIECYDCYTE
jgi:hypothetical protein